MTSENETVKDIVKEIGDAYETWKRSEIAELPTQYLMEWRDRLDVADRRIEAAHQREVAELRECLKEAMADAVAEYKNNSCFRNVKCGEIERCKTCKVVRWRKTLKGVSNEDT